MICEILAWIFRIFIIVYAAGGICDAILDIRGRPDPKALDDAKRTARQLALHTRFMEAMDKEDYATARAIFYEYVGEDEDEEEDTESNRFIDGFVKPVLEGMYAAMHTMVYGLACFHLRIRLVIYRFIGFILHG